VLLNPAAARGIADVHELDANGAAVDAPCFVRELIVDSEIDVRGGTKKTERIEVGFEISPVAECVEHAFAFSIGRVQYRGGRLCTSLGSACHNVCY